MAMTVLNSPLHPCFYLYYSISELVETISVSPFCQSVGLSVTGEQPLLQLKKHCLLRWWFCHKECGDGRHVNLDVTLTLMGTPSMHDPQIGKRKERKKDRKKEIGLYIEKERMEKKFRHIE